ncbi:hypothetical protein [Paenibacillus sp. UNC451MF]|uniref:hypothetical protein n=1 Tax=Paenibacillus sp. UNC451MF TaxID=1449063 RepID=UPI000A822B8D|nr:hypothetical protein [Paenibacillus sp. UNC451MF]
MYQATLLFIFLAKMAFCGADGYRAKDDLTQSCRKAVKPTEPIKKKRWSTL